ncbi:MAG: HNH endonuclease [Verrucomicrobiales bacterium]|nr:HNH endonuclease [Verrucomicrobiales bacterium]
MTSPGNLRQRVEERANHRCEYCGISQVGQEAVFHVDHIHPVSLGGESHEENFALACVSCSLRKGARATVIDPDTDEPVPIFNPRKDAWNHHFRWSEFEVVGISPIGRATAVALAMNRPIILGIRKEEALRGRHPPPNHV